MKQFANLKFVVLFVALAVVPFAAGVYSERAAAYEGKVHAQATTPPASSAAKEEEVTYQYVAQAGDSYSLMARKAIQTFGITSKTSLSRAQIIFAETHMTQEAKSPVLNLGQKVSIEESAVKSWVEKAQKLSAAQQKAWDVYAQYADFNTNRVGQAR